MPSKQLIGSRLVPLSINQRNIWGKICQTLTYINEHETTAVLIQMPLRKDKHHESILNFPRVLLLNTESQSCGAQSFGHDPNEAGTLYPNIEEI